MGGKVKPSKESIMSNGIDFRMPGNGKIESSEIFGWMKEHGYALHTGDNQNIRIAYYKEYPDDGDYILRIFDNSYDGNDRDYVLRIGKRLTAKGKERALKFIQDALDGKINPGRYQ